MSLLATVTAFAADIPEYRVGEAAREDTVTPIPLVVLDTEGTVALKQKEGSRVSVLCRYYTNALDEAEAQLRTAVALSRSNLLDRIAAAFNRPVLEEADLGTPRFERLIASFLRQNKTFPVSTNLALAWASGEKEQVVEDELLPALQKAMEHPLRPANISVEVKFGYSVRLVPLATWQENPSLDQAEKRAITSSRSNIVTISRAREDLIDAFSIEQRPAAKFLAALLKTNCIPDEEWTKQARARRTEGLAVADRYEAGQMIARKGQAIDSKTKAALDLLKEKLAVGNLQQQVRETQQQAAVSSTRVRWILAGSAFVLVVAVGLVWLLARRRPHPAPQLAVARTDDMRERLFPHLVGILKDKFVQKMITHRTQLLDAQAKALNEMLELEARLERIHAPLQDRLRAYEQRIAELEKELLRKGEENRELIRAKIQLARKQLENARSRLDLN